MTNRLLPLVLLATLMVGSLLDPATVFADRGRVHLRDGSVIHGEVVTYDPGIGVTVQLTNGSVIELSADDVARVDIGSEAPAPAQATVPSPSAVADAAAPVHASRVTVPDPPRASLQRPGLVGPIVMGSVGLLLVATGTPIYLNSFECYDCYEFTPRGIAGLSVMGVGGALAISGFGIWMAKRVKARCHWGSEDGPSVSIRPSLGRDHAGLQLSGTF